VTALPPLFELTTQLNEIEVELWKIIVRLVGAWATEAAILLIEFETRLTPT
jgi:hypothetical protein